VNATTSSSTVRFERRRTVWDIVFGLLSVVAGVIALGHVATASLVSVLFLGWMLILGGLVLVAAAIALWKEANHRWDLAAGALFLVIGFSFVRNPEVGVLTLTLVAGSLLLVGGIVRIIAAFQPGAPRAVLLLNGAVTLVLGLMVLNRWPVSALWFLGTVLGIQLILDGLTTALVGRIRVVETPERTHEPA
jgi:uncharacterized membrane protein HdeD (DUF308 family)